MTKAERRDAKRTSRRNQRSTGIAAFRYHGRPEELAAAKTRASLYRRDERRIRHAV